METVMRKGIKEFVIDTGLTEKNFCAYFNEFTRRCNEPKVERAKVKALFKAVKNIENQFEKL